MAYKATLAILSLLSAFVTFSALGQAPAPLYPDNMLGATDTIGLPPHASTEGTSEVVNLTNGALNMFLPVLTLPQQAGSAPLVLGFTYDSNQINLQQNIQALPSFYDAGSGESLGSSCDAAEGGCSIEEEYQYTMSTGETTLSPDPLQINFPQLVGSLEYEGDVIVNGNYPNAQALYVMPEFCLVNISFIDWSGSAHPFPRANLNCNDQVPTDIRPISTVLKADSNDNLFYRLDGTNPNDYTVTAPDGTVYHFANPNIPCPNSSSVACAENSNSEQYLHQVATSIVDRNGATITISGNQITDTLGRVITIAGSSGGSQSNWTSTISYKDSQGQPQSVTLSMASGFEPIAGVTGPDIGPVLTNSTCWITAPSGPPPAIVYDPLQIDGVPDGWTAPAGSGGPDGTGFTPYDITFSGSTKHYHLLFDSFGHLMKIVYPSGGYHRYDYSINPTTILQGPISCTWNAAQVSHRYECSNSSGSCSQENTTTYDLKDFPNTVTEPDGTVTSHSFGPIYDFPSLAPVETDTSIASADGTILKTIHYDYQPYTYDGTPEPSMGFENALPTKITTTYPGGSSSSSTYTAYVYDTVTPTVSYDDAHIGNPTHIDVYGFDGTHLQSTVQTWFYSGNILNKLQSSVVTDPLTGISSSLSYNYDSKGNVNSVTHSGTGVGPYTTSFLLDAYGRPLTATDPRGFVTTYGYGDSWDNASCAPAIDSQAYVTSIKNALNQTTSYKYNSCTGTLASVTDANQQATSYQYDALGRVTDESFPDQGHTHVAFVDSAPNSVTTTVTATPDPNIVTSVALDGLGRSSVNTAANGATIETTYDAGGRVASITNAHFSTPSSTDGTTFFAYDALDRKTVEMQPDSSALRWSYSGNVTTSTDEVGNQWIRTSDALGRLTNVTEPGGLQTAYTYDALDNLLSATQTGISGETPRTRGFTYDSLSRLLTAINPETGTISYSYDANGNMLTKTDSRGVTTSYTYDALNRLLLKSYSDGTHIVGFGYDGNLAGGAPLSSQGISTSNAVGRLSQVSTLGGNADKTFGYDPMGRLITQTNCLPDNCGNRQFEYATYDLAGNMTDFTYPDGHHITQTWDGAGHLATSQLVDINGTSTSQSYLQSASYFPDGSPQVLTLGNGVQQIIGKNNRLQVQSMVASTPLAPFNEQSFLSHTYCYVSCTTGGTANNGNIWGITDTLNASQTQGFTYDNLNRIKSFSLGGVVGQQFNYDSFGNMSPMAGANPVYTFDPATNRISNLPCAASLTPYDAGGNQTCDTDSNGALRTYSFDAENRIKQIAMLGSTTPFETYTYNADSSRVRKDNVNGTYTEYVYFNGQPMAEKDQSGAWKDYIYAGDKKIASTENVDTRIHLSGTTIQTGYELQVGVPFQSGYVIKTGDKISWRQYNQNAVGGLNVSFVNNGWSDWHLQTYDGQDAGQDFNEGRWEYRTALLNDYVGLTINGILLVKDVFNPPGNWSIYIGDIAIMSTDGTVTHIFTGEPYSLSPQGVDSSYDSSFSAVVETVPISSDPTITNGSTINATKFYLGDHLGTAQLELSSGGWPVWKGQFAPFGQELDTQFTANRYKFTGKERDIESGLDYFGARYFASTMGRWMSPDWSDKPEAVPYSDLMNPQSLNLYGYVNNNPLSKADKDGHCLEDACVVEGATAVVAFGALTVSAYLQTPSGQRNLANAASSAAATISSTFNSLFSSSSSSTPAPTAPAAGQEQQSTPAPTTGEQTGQPAPAVAQPNPGGQIMVGPSGTAVVIPPGQAARPADNGNGTVIGPPATVGSSNANTTRLMGPTTQNPTGYVRTYNGNGQPVNPSTGKPDSNDKTHLPL